MVEVELIVVGVQRQEQVEDGFQRLLGLGVGAVDLVDHHDGLQAQLQRLGQHELGLRHHAFGRVHQQHHAIHHREDALHLAAEIGMAGRVHDVEAHAVPFHRGAFGQDGDAALALLVVGIHGALGHVLVLAHRAGLLEQLVHQRGLAMVDMGDDGDVADFHDTRINKRKRSGAPGLIDACPAAEQHRACKSCHAFVGVNGFIKLFGRLQQFGLDFSPHL